MNFSISWRKKISNTFRIVYPVSNSVIFKIHSFFFLYEFCWKDNNFLYILLICFYLMLLIKNKWKTLKCLHEIHVSCSYFQEKTKKLWFGRDFFGRRSLCWHLPQSSTDPFLLTSVRQNTEVCLYKVLHIYTITMYFPPINKMMNLPTISFNFVGVGWGTFYWDLFCDFDTNWLFTHYSV